MVRLSSFAKFHRPPRITRDSRIHSHKVGTTMHSRIPFSLLVAVSMTASATMAAQAVVPIRELSAADAKTSEQFGSIFGVRQLAGGKVLVNDGTRRQLVVLDANFLRRTVLVDSVAEGGQSYGPRAAPLIPYLADSSLFVDGASLSLLVIDPNGKIAHVMSAPKPSDLRSLASSASGVDAQGNLIYRGALSIGQPKFSNMGQPGQAPTAIQPADSADVLRANFDTRVVDTIGKVKVQSGTVAKMGTDANGKMSLNVTINPLITVDEWSVLSDGTVAFIRGHDYHIDWIHPDGKKSSSEKLPFDWKRLTDQDKQALIDSARAAQDAAAAASKGDPMKALNDLATAAGMGGGGGMSVEIHRDGGGGVAVAAGGGGGRVGMPGGFTMPVPHIDFVSIKEIADYYPAIRQGAAKADLDGNLWILPTTSAQSKHGELVYDVVNNKGELFERVRLPDGRSIAGFGHSGVVYLMYRDGTTGWLLERTKVLNNARATY